MRTLARSCSRRVFGRSAVRIGFASLLDVVGSCGLFVAVATLMACPSGGRPGPTVPPLGAGGEQRATALLAASGVKDASLESSQRARLVALANQNRCPCEGEKASLAECAPSKRCVRAPFALRAIIRGLQRKLPDGAITAQLLERFGPREPEAIDLLLAHCRGSKRAPVTLVVFSDFQCPYCSLARKLLTALEREYGDKQLRTCFLNFVVHKGARMAARAGIAAQLQGKFWPYHDKLFSNMRAQSRGDLLAYARDLKLDTKRFARDLDGDQVKIRLLRHETIASKLRLQATPSFFINGRPMVGPKSRDTFRDWIDEALAIHAAKGIHAAKANASKPAATKPATPPPAQ